MARGHYRILLGMAAGVGKTYRMLQEGRQAQAEGRDVVIGYLEPHDRPETDGARRRARGRAAPARRSTAALELEEMDVDAVIARAPELALIDELAHTNAPGHAQREALAGHRGGARRRHRRHLDRQRPAPREPQRRDLRAHRGPRARDVPRPGARRGRRGRARRPDARGAAGAPARPARSTRRTAPRSRSRTSSGPTTSRRCGSSRCARSPRTSRRAGIATVLDPLSQQAVAERVLALVEPQPKSQRILRRAWRSAAAARQRDRRALGAAEPAAPPTDEEATQLAALRRLAGVLGVALPRGGGRRPRRRRSGASPRERGSTYIFVGTPDESRRREIFGGSLLSRMVRELPGIDIRVVANRADRRG